VLPAGGYVAELREAGFEWIPWGLERRSMGVGRELRALLEIVRVVDDVQPGVVHAFTTTPVVYLSAVVAWRSLRRRPRPRVLINNLTGLGYLRPGPPGRCSTSPSACSPVRSQGRGAATGNSPTGSQPVLGGGDLPRALTASSPHRRAEVGPVLACLGDPGEVGGGADSWCPPLPGCRLASSQRAALGGESCRPVGSSPSWNGCSWPRRRVGTLVWRSPSTRWWVA
jgi:hypothetical protein